MRKNSIIPMDVSSSRDSYNTRTTNNAYKGTSFNFSGQWAAGVHYFNDEYVVDFVSWDGSLWACQRNHLSTHGNEPGMNDRMWTNVISGIRGKAYVPRVSNGKLTFELSDNASAQAIDITTLRGEDGISGESAYDIAKRNNPRIGSEKDWLESLRGKDGYDGRDGRDGKDGVVYKPTKIADGKLYFTSDTSDVVTVDVSGLQGAQGIQGEKGEAGEDGKVPEFLNNVKIYQTVYGSQASATLTPIVQGDSIAYQLNLVIPEGRPGTDGAAGATGERGAKGDRGDIGPRGEKGDKGDRGERGERGEKGAPGQTGPRGDKGDKGERGEKGDRGEKGERGATGKAGATPMLKLISNEQSNSVSLLSSVDNGSSWDNLGDVGGKSPKLIRVLSDPDNPDVQDETRRNDRILWGYDGVPVSEWSTLCYLDDLRGDENIWIGCKEPRVNYEDKNGEIKSAPAKYKIWYDPCEDTTYPYEIDEFLYLAYRAAAGDNAVSENEFKEILSNLGKRGFNIQVVESLPTPTAALYERAIYMVPSKNPYTYKGKKVNWYDEWIVVKSADGNYMWEKLGDDDFYNLLTNYATKEEFGAFHDELNAEMTRFEKYMEDYVTNNDKMYWDSFF